MKIDWDLKSLPAGCSKAKKVAFCWQGSHQNSHEIAINERIALSRLLSPLHLSVGRTVVYRFLLSQEATIAMKYTLFPMASVVLWLAIIVLSFRTGIGAAIPRTVRYCNENGGAIDCGTYTSSQSRRRKGCPELASPEKPGYCAGDQASKCIPCVKNSQCQSKKCFVNVSGCSVLPEHIAVPRLWRSDPNMYYQCNKPGLFALTFDDGPDVHNTETVLDELRSLDVKATFFITGWQTNLTTGRIITRIEKDGHTVASHTFSHRSMIRELGPSIKKYIEDEVIRNERVLSPLLPLRGLRKYIRPPYLEIGYNMSQALGQLGYKIVQINVDTKDYKQNKTVDQIVNTFEYALNYSSVEKNSFISLQHDTFAAKYLAALPRVVTAIRKKGFRIVTMEECIGPAEKAR